MSNLPALVVTTPPTKYCEVCRIRGKLCPLFTKSVPHSFPSESEWSDEDWDGERERKEKGGRTTEERREERQQKVQNKCQMIITVV